MIQLSYDVNDIQWLKQPLGFLNCNKKKKICCKISLLILLISLQDSQQVIKADFKFIHSTNLYLNPELIANNQKHSTHWEFYNSKFLDVLGKLQEFPSFKWEVGFRLGGQVWRISQNAQRFSQIMNSQSALERFKSFNLDDLIAHYFCFRAVAWQSWPRKYSERSPSALHWVSALALARVPGMSIHLRIPEHAVTRA